MALKDGGQVDELKSRIGELISLNDRLQERLRMLY
jgi:hypothetical protein